MTGEQFITILISLLGVMAFIAGILFWRIFTRMEKKIDDWFAEHLKCREKQMSEFVKVKEFEDWKEGRDPLWRRINRHSHDVAGKVIITEDI